MVTSIPVYRESSNSAGVAAVVNDAIVFLSLVISSSVRRYSSRCLEEEATGEAEARRFKLLLDGWPTSIWSMVKSESASHIGAVFPTMLSQLVSDSAFAENFQSLKGQLGSLPNPVIY